MSYILKQVTIRTDNSEKGISEISGLWKDISEGKIPLLFDSEKNSQKDISPVSKYSNYSSDENGKYDLSVITVTADFFKELDKAVERKEYIKYIEKDENGDISICAQNAWKRVWEDQKSGKIDRKFTEDYESTVPKDYTNDGMAHCYLYIAIKQ